MRPAEIKKLLKAEPFTPVRVGSSDGRSVIIRHPDQAVIAERHLLIGLATLERSKPDLVTPKSSDAIPRDWMIINLLHIVAIEPSNDKLGHRRPRRKSWNGRRSALPRFDGDYSIPA